MGSVGCTSPKWRWSNHVINHRPFFIIRSSFHDLSLRRLLVLGYSSGLQIWDCTNLDSIAEILNVTSPEWGRVLQAEVLPNPPAAGDEFLNARPLLGMMCVDFLLPLLY